MTNINSVEIVEDDLSHIMVHTKEFWVQVKNKTIFLTGGTGFFGVWLLKTFLYANKKLQNNTKIIVLTRSIDRFLIKHVEFKDVPEILFLEGDVKTFTYPKEAINYIIHAATDASVALNNEEPLIMLDTIVEGTRRVLELAVEKNTEAFLLTSSGAVYGVQPSDISHVDEGYRGSPDTSSHIAAYGEGKRMAEVLCAIYSKKYGLNTKIARCFAFVGPYLPIDSHFAIGNFIRDILKGNEIRIQGDGSPYRSYMYASDLIIWLLHILLNGKTARQYNVGSGEELTIEQLAEKVSSVSGKEVSIHITAPKTNNSPSRYVPSVKRANEELGLSITIGLTEAIDKTIRFYS